MAHAQPRHGICDQVRHQLHWDSRSRRRTDGGGDGGSRRRGFLLFNNDFTRRYVMEICDGLVPALQRRGLTRTGYPHKNFRDSLTAF
jgi:hypothetical protein